jgi:hypothetical protein
MQNPRYGTLKLWNNLSKKYIFTSKSCLTKWLDSDISLQVTRKLRKWNKNMINYQQVRKNVKIGKINLIKNYWTSFKAPNFGKLKDKRGIASQKKPINLNSQFYRYLRVKDQITLSVRHNCVSMCSNWSKEYSHFSKTKTKTIFFRTCPNEQIMIERSLINYW